MWEFSNKCRNRLGSQEYSDDAIRYFLEDDPKTPESEKPCWEAVLDSGGFVKHLKREFGVDPRYEIICIVWASMCSHGQLQFPSNLVNSPSAVAPSASLRLAIGTSFRFVRLTHDVAYMHSPLEHITRL